MRSILLALFIAQMTLSIPVAIKAQQPGAQEKKYFRLLQQNFQEQQAYQTVAFVEQRWRLAGNSGFNESIYYVERILQQAGFVKETKGEEDAVCTYRIEKRPMKEPAWEPVDAQLYIVGDTVPLLEFRTNRNMLAIGSASTPEGGITAELEYITKIADTGKHYLEGKIVLLDGAPISIAKMAERGAVGVLSYEMPAYTQPAKHQHSIQFGGAGYKDPQQKFFRLLLSYAAKERLKAALAKGAVKVRVITKVKTYPGEELTIVANVRGSVRAHERFVFSAHVQEPGANDNASGVGTLAEMARVTAQLVNAGKLLPQRTITFLWGDEIVSTRRYIQEDSLRAKGIKWGLSLDMVGEDTKKTGGTFLIEKMPDPSAIWTRGNDKHSEWGGSPLAEEDMFPHYFNDLLLNRCLQEAAATGWVVNTNPFEGGSDHTPFLQAKIPGLLMWHFTDVYYHTDGDRLNMVSATEMRHVGISALVTAYLLTTADTKTTVGLVRELTWSARERLEAEYRLSKTAIAQGGNVEKERHILATWENWYLKAIAAMDDIAVDGQHKTITNAIAQAKEKIRKQVKGSAL